MKTVYSILLALVSHIAFAQSDFVTQRDLSKSGSGASQISFGVRTLGPVSYTWTEVSPSTASGSGVFSGSTATFSGLRSGATIDLHISPVNFQRIIINDGPDRLRLVDIKQWGTTTWTSMAMAFWGCNNLQVSATDIPGLTRVGNMESMFRECWVMTGPNNIGEWDMEKSTTAFDQPLGNWIFPSYMWTESMFKNSGLSCQNYSETLKQWAANPALPNGFTLDASDLTYSPSTTDAHNYLRNTEGWNISGDVKSETECGGPLPVTVVSFFGQKNSENLNVLGWTTTQEKDLDRFEVQRASDARSFSTICAVKGTNTHTSLI